MSLWITLWMSNHAAITHPSPPKAITRHPQHSRFPVSTNHETIHANHAGGAITQAPLFSKGACVLRCPPRPGANQ